MSSIRDIAAATFRRRPPKVIAALPFVFAAAFGAPQASAQIAIGTVMASTGSGKVTEFTQTGTMITQIDTTTGATFMTGSMFDATGNFFVTNFGGQAVSKFDPFGVLVNAAFGSGYNADPESILHDAAGIIYVGQADGSRNVLKFDPSGTLLTTFAPATGPRGTDWIDLAADQCTLFYTSEGVLVKRFNVCTNTQLTDFNVAPLPGSFALALRLLPSGGMLVADTSAVIRLDAFGIQVQTYVLAGTLFALNLDPDGTSFWTGDASGGQVYKVDIASGTVLQSWSTTGAAGFIGLSGLSVKGEKTVGGGGNKCPFSQGYWKNHPNAWPVNSLTLGSKTYLKAELLAILRTPVRGDASLILAYQLIAAKLNIANGSNGAPVSTTITDADSLLSGFSGKLPFQVAPSSPTGQAMVNDASTLDSYNNGALTPTCTQ